MRGYDLYKRDTLAKMKAKGALANEIWDTDNLGEIVNKKWNAEDCRLRAQYNSKAKKQSGQASGQHDDKDNASSDGDNAHGALGRPLPITSLAGVFPLNPRDVEIYQEKHSFAKVVADFEARRGIRQLPHHMETKHDPVVKLPQCGRFQGSHIFIFIPSPIR